MEAGAAKPKEEEDAYHDAELLVEHDLKDKWEDWWVYLCNTVIYLAQWAYKSRVAQLARCFMVAAYICACSSVSVGWDTPYILHLKNGVFTATTILEDKGHQLVAYVLACLGSEFEYINCHHLPDMIVGWVMCMTAVLIACSPQPGVIMRRVFFLLTILFLLRSITIQITSLPDASPHCGDQFLGPDGAQKLQERTLARLMYRAYKFCAFPGRHKTCGDMVFSGNSFVSMFVGTCLCLWVQRLLLLPLLIHFNPTHTYRAYDDAHDMCNGLLVLLQCEESSHQRGLSVLACDRVHLHRGAVLHGLDITCRCLAHYRHLVTLEP